MVSTVPTLAALWPAGPLDGVRLLILGGEACPPELAERLARPRARGVEHLRPDRGDGGGLAARLSGGEPVRIGLPLDGWRLAVVDPRAGSRSPWGEVGELVIGGVGVARYLDAEQGRRRIPAAGGPGLGARYRSGDLVRADPEGLVYLGRADEQVKIRGYRIELGEIEAVLAELPGIGLAAVTTYEPLPGVVELAGYYTVAQHGLTRGSPGGPGPAGR